MKLIFAFLFLLISFSIQAQFCEYDSISICPSVKNKKIFIEGESIFFNTVITNKSSKPKNRSFVIKNVELENKSLDTIYHSPFASHEHSYDKVQNVIAPYQHFDITEPSIQAVHLIGKWYYFDTSIPERVYYFQPGKYKMNITFDLIPTGIFLNCIYDFQVLPASDIQLKEYRAYINCIDYRKQSLEHYDQSNPLSVESFVSKYPNSVYKDDLYYYLLTRIPYLTLNHAGTELDNIYWLAFIKDLINNLIHSDNIAFRTQLADKLPKLVSALKGFHAISDEQEFVDEILQSITTDSILSSRIIKNCERDLNLRGLKNYAKN